MQALTTILKKLEAFLPKKIDFKLRIVDNFPSYENQYLLAPFASYTYLQYLDIQVCEYLKNTLKLPREALKYTEYLLINYSVEIALAKQLIRIS